MTSTTNINTHINNNNNMNINSTTNYLKRKRDSDIDIIENAMRSNRINEIKNDMEDLIAHMETSTILNAHEEYKLLFESQEYKYDEKTIDFIINKAETRFKRYIKCVNFYAEGYPIVKDYIERFLFKKNKCSKMDSLILIKKIDETLLTILDEIYAIKKQKETKKVNFEN